MRRHHRSFRRSGSRRKIAWGQSGWAGEFIATIPAGTGLFDVQWVKVPAGALNTSVAPDGAIEPQDWTLVRSLCAIHMNTLSSDPGFIQTLFCAGIIVWEGMTDVPPSILDVPSPAVNGDADWIWRWASPCSSHFGAGGVAQFADSLLGPQLNYETRAQRKLSARQGLLLVAGIDNSVSTNGTTDLSYAFDFRGAFKLP